MTGAPGTTKGPWRIYPYVQRKGQFAIEQTDAVTGFRQEIGQTYMVLDGDPLANAHQIAASGALYDAVEAADEMQRWLAAEIATRTHEAEELNNPRAWDDFDDCMRDGRLASYRDQFEAALKLARGEA